METSASFEARSAPLLYPTRLRRPEMPAIAVTHPSVTAEILKEVTQLLGPGRTTRRWPRKTVLSGLNAHINDSPAIVVNVSYGGLRFEMAQPPPALASRLVVELPPFGLTIQARPVWSAQPDASSGPWRCGAELAESSWEPLRLWRRLVDLLPHGGDALSRPGTS